MQYCTGQTRQTGAAVQLRSVYLDQSSQSERSIPEKTRQTGAGGAGAGLLRDFDRYTDLNLLFDSRTKAPNIVRPA